MAENVVEKPKRRPGRPKADNMKALINMQGICDAPLNKDNAIELYYANPMVFRRIFALYKATNVGDIIMKFDKTNIILYAKSFSDRITFKTTIDCTKVHRYYCDRPLELRMGCKGSEDIINRIDPKFYDNMSILIKQYTSEVDNIIFTLQNQKLDAITSMRLNLSSISNHVDEDQWNDADYKLSFNLKRCEFKKYMGDIDTISSTLMITRAGNTPLKFSYSKEGGIVNGEEIFKSDEKLRLNSTMTNNEIIAMTVRMSDIKPLSNAQIADDIQIFIDSFKKMMFKVKIDNAIETKILVAIEDYRDNVR